MDLNCDALHEISRLQEDILQALRSELKKLRVPDVRGASIASIPAEENGQSLAEESEIQTPQVSQACLLQPKRLYSPLINYISTPRIKTNWGRKTVVENTKVIEKVVKKPNVRNTKFDYKSRNYPRPWAETPPKKKTLSDESMEVHMTSSHFSDLSATSATFQPPRLDQFMAFPVNQSKVKNDSVLYPATLNRVSRGPNSISIPDWPKVDGSGLLRVKRWKSQPPAKIRTTDSVILKDPTKMDVNCNYLDEETTRACFRYSEQPVIFALPKTVDSISTYSLSRRRLKLESLLDLCGFSEDLLKGIDGPKEMGVLNVENYLQQPASKAADMNEDTKSKNSKVAHVKLEQRKRPKSIDKLRKKESDISSKPSTSRKIIPSKSKLDLARNTCRKPSNGFCNTKLRRQNSQQNKQVNCHLKALYCTRCSQTVTSYRSNHFSSINSNSTSPFRFVQPSLCSCATSLSGIGLRPALDGATSPVHILSCIAGVDMNLDAVPKISGKMILQTSTDQNKNIDPEGVRSNNASSFKPQATALELQSRPAIVVDCKPPLSPSGIIPLMPEKTLFDIKTEDLPTADKETTTYDRILLTSPSYLDIKACSSNYNLPGITEITQADNPMCQKQASESRRRARCSICPVRRVFQKRNAKPPISSKRTDFESFSPVLKQYYLKPKESFQV